MHFLAGRNADPASKNADFLAMLDARSAPDSGVALLEYCYLDMRADGDPATVFSEYKATVAAARARHPLRREPDDAQVELHRRFARLLEHDFARRHDAGHYADALAVPAAALSRALSEATGRTTKDLILDRVMLEAARLLRYTDRTVGEVAHATGFTDPLYFSRAFKRRFGESPMAYRDHVRGRDPS